MRKLNEFQQKHKNMLEKYMNQLNIPEKQKGTVRGIYSRLQQVCNVEGRNPNTVCGAAIMLSVRILKLDISTSDISDRVGMKEQTLNQFLKTIRKDEHFIMGKDFIQEPF